MNATRHDSVLDLERLKRSKRKARVTVSDPLDLL